MNNVPSTTARLTDSVYWNRNLKSFVCATTLVGADILAWSVSIMLPGRTLSAKISLLLMGWVVWCLLKGSYTHRSPFWSELRLLLKWVLGFLFIAIITQAVASDTEAITKTLQTSALVFFILPIGRAGSKRLLSSIKLGQRPAVIFGTLENAYQASLAVASEPSLGFEMQCFVQPQGQPVAASISCTGAVVNTWYLDVQSLTPYKGMHCVIALEADQWELRDKLIRYLASVSTPNIHVIPAMRGIPLYAMQTTQFFSHEVLMIHLGDQLSNPFKRLLKRLFDVFASTILLALLSPLFLVLIVAAERDGGSAFFSHRRIGRGGIEFDCYKFRSMVNGADQLLAELLARDPEARTEWDNGRKLKNDPRVNKVGHFLRKTSLDELPQLWNVLRGDMSLVGPRPVVQEELGRYGDDVIYYLMTRPGITGLWQVSGRSDVGYDTRVYLDSWYVKNWSLWTDIAILFKTVKVVSSKRGAY